MWGRLSKGIFACLQIARPNQDQFHSLKPVLSCVVDQHPKFLMQVWIWLISAKHSGAFEDCHVVIHHVGPAPTVLQVAADRFGAILREVEAFGDGAARYCNKLQSHAPILSMEASGTILTDVDLFFLSSPRICFDEDFVQSKVVDHPNPPTEMLSELAQILNLNPMTYEAVPTFRPKSRTQMMNCNGGLYAIPKKHLEILAPQWRAISTRCLSESSILGRWLHHSDQIGFLMGMLRTELPFRPLALRHNFPTHFKVSDYESIQTDDIRILHYHDKLDAQGRLIRTGHAGVDRYIDQANAILRPYEELPEYKEIQSLFAASQ